MKDILRVSLEGWSYKFSAGMEIDMIMYKAFMPIDFVSEKWMTSITPSAISIGQAKTVMKIRNDAAERIAEKLTEMIVQAMSSRDTIDGYEVKK